MLSDNNKSLELQTLAAEKPFDGFMAAEMYVKEFLARIREDSKPNE
jgi:hypothetical protein